MLRSHTCGELTKAHVGRVVTLAGWVHAVRDHGGVTFLDIRDRYGLTQVICPPDRLKPEVLECAKQVKSESVVRITGTVVERPPATVNRKIATGEIEVTLENVTVLNAAGPLPFEISGDTEPNENVRLTYRYLDLRRKDLGKNLFLRSKFCQAVREYLLSKDFAEVDTPILTRSTPEGARDFLVPSRLNPGKFYALPQSPQLFKQILMVGGMDRYFQIARCFRDEDLRADRQPEFTQIDIEMSFVEEEDVIALTEGMVAHACEKIFDRPLQTPFPRMSYADAMEKYGTDKPDLRFGLELRNLSDVFAASPIDFLKKILEKEGTCIKGFAVPEGEKVSLKDVENLTALVKERGGVGVGWIRFRPDGVQSPLKKVLDDETTARLKERTGATDGGLLLFLAGARDWVDAVLGEIRVLLGTRLYPQDKSRLLFHWVVDFPLFEYNREEKRLETRHHPFTSPRPQDIATMESDPLKTRACAYDLVLNGIEIGGGSLRIHTRDVQEKMFRTIGMSKEIAENRFGFLMEAFNFGAPPHGGIALGLDRFMMILTGGDSIRDVIAFPKTQKGVCLMTAAPGEVDETALKENRIKIDIPPSK